MSLSGKVALVTGGARGLGAATGVRLSQMGATVHIADLDEIDAKEAPDLPTAVRKSHRLDVTDYEAWSGVIADIVNEEGRLDILHLNAGVQARPIGKPTTDDPLLWFDERVCDRLIAVNVKGVTNGVMAALPLLRKSHGAIIVTASMAGVRGFADDPLYSMTKHAVVGLTRSLGPRLARDGVCISAICPGGIYTRMIAPNGVDQKARLNEPDHVAEMICQLIVKRDPGGIWLIPADGSVRKFEVDPLDYTEEQKISILGLAGLGG